MLSEEIEEFD